MLHASEYIKIKITVPKTHVDIVRKILGESGAGRVGNYDYCSYVYPVQGHFRPLEGANPAIGDVGKEEEVEEICIEAICHKDLVEKVITEVKKVHPYEEMAFDIMPRYDI